MYLLYKNDILEFRENVLKKYIENEKMCSVLSICILLSKQLFMPLFIISVYFILDDTNIMMQIVNTLFVFSYGVSMIDINYDKVKDQFKYQQMNKALVKYQIVKNLDNIFLIAFITIMEPMFTIPLAVIVFLVIILRKKLALKFSFETKYQAITSLFLLLIVQNFWGFILGLICYIAITKSFSKNTHYFAQKKQRFLYGLIVLGTIISFEQILMTNQTIISLLEIVIGFDVVAKYVWNYGLASVIILYYFGLTINYSIAVSEDLRILVHKCLSQTLPKYSLKNHLLVYIVDFSLLSYFITKAFVNPIDILLLLTINFIFLIVFDWLIIEYSIMKKYNANFVNVDEKYEQYTMFGSSAIFFLYLQEILYPFITSEKTGTQNLDLQGFMIISAAIALALLLGYILLKEYKQNVVKLKVRKVEEVEWKKLHYVD
ncbi:MAG: hypothetical protein ACRCUP_00145 [Mycoplasmatales bacterium]